MSDRGTNNSPKTRNPERPHSHPKRLDQYGADMEEVKEKDSDVTSNKETK